MKTTMIPDWLFDRLKRSPSLYEPAKQVRFFLGNVLGSRRIPGIPGRVHWNDYMFTTSDKEGVDAYNRSGVNFVRQLEEAITLGGRSWADIGHCLDIGCGYGRILRALCQKTAPANIWVCDTVDMSAHWCAKEFGVHYSPVIGVEGFAPGRPYGLAYLLSVFSHTPRETTITMIRSIAQVLDPGGIMVFTTQGKTAANEKLHLYPHPTPSYRREINAQLELSGYYYMDYSHYRQKGYGLTWYTEQSIRALTQEAVPEFELIAFWPAGCDEIQDISVYRKAKGNR
jgi:SAM-dependent methyltransferase